MESRGLAHHTRGSHPRVAHGGMRRFSKIVGECQALCEILCLMPSLTLRHAVSLFETGYWHTHACAAHGQGGTLRVILPWYSLAPPYHQATQALWT